ncbi:MAG TPA: hypothetical protein DCZ92_11745, partial [Elusimicrobia bacterium]|nr:hypothetical protein [Elusimicrobiota bacterium]
NPLGGIMGFAQLVLNSDGLSPQQREDVETILTQSRRCDDIVKNLLQFSRIRKGNEMRVDCRKAVEATLQLAAFDLRRAGIKVVKDFPEGLPPVMGDAGQLQQVFLNIIMNALHAMEGKKRAELKILASETEGRILLRFEDNGCGIPPENLSKIFDPFFTTKPAGKGTGLGLSISYGIIQENKGTIRAENLPGQGAAFVISLPVCEEKGEKAAGSGR